MLEFPHVYKVEGNITQGDDVRLSSEGVADIVSAPPPQFDGPGDKWSPESLLVAAVTDCFILTFKAIARASRLEWDKLDCSVEGVLDRVDKQLKFVEYRITATLHVQQGVRIELAERLLEKAEQSCLITNSLNGKTILAVEVIEDS